jgi:hypothetical protein
VRHPGGNAQHLAGTDSDIAIIECELQRAAEHIGQLFALVRVGRDDGAALEIDLREHFAIAGDEPP